MVAQLQSRNSDGDKPSFGYIKTFCPKKGWGFIISDEVPDRDIFVHWKNFASKAPQNFVKASGKNHVEVKFLLDESDPKKPKATDVRITSEIRGHSPPSHRPSPRRGRGERSDSRCAPRLLEAPSASSGDGPFADNEDRPPLLRGRRRQGGGNNLARSPTRSQSRSRSLRRKGDRSRGSDQQQQPLSRQRRDHHRQSDVLPLRSRSELRRERERDSKGSQGSASPSPLKRKGAGPGSDVASGRRRRATSVTDAEPLRNASRSRSAASSRGTDRARIQQSSQPEQWPTSGGTLKVLLPLEVFRKVDANGFLPRVEGSTGATLAFTSRVEGRPGHRLLVVKAGSSLELREAMQQVLLEVSDSQTGHQDEGLKGTTVTLKLLLQRDVAALLKNQKDLHGEGDASFEVEQSSSRNWGSGEVAVISGTVGNALDALARILKRQREHAVDVSSSSSLNQVAEEKSDDRNREKKEDTSSSELPAPWKLEEHPEAPGEFYYLNTETGETTWDRPQAEDLSQDASSVQVDTKASAEAAADEATPKAAAKKSKKAAKSTGKPTIDAPPPPWTRQEHPEAPGEYYYLNEDTGETCWELPKTAEVQEKKATSKKKKAPAPSKANAAAKAE
eukprot:TRINITY_DN27336_c0_g1_i1.p1 TRINITY_DN27336_c0_g1~~TRINITY_DN27336_c0_g1_i1.p1  ORF type:complete len:618 (-),score=124.89 TRINITY_DN27336_c0_g1_i1:52-1905(-)